MTPSVGRIVHYVMPNRQHRAAIVTHVHNQTLLSLSVFAVPSIDLVAPFATDAVVEGDPNSPDTWHWPERVDA